MNGDGTHNKKRTHEFATKGATPIEKNVIVVDESGNEYGATYSKRARGLVKSGRARFIDENKICLACPPNINEITEDIKMSENMNIEAVEVAETTEIAEATEAVETVENTATKYTIDYVLEQIEKLHADKEFYSTITNEFKSVMAVNSDSFAAAESAQAIGKAIMCRETTNQQLIAFYEKMYDDLKPKTTKPTMQVDEAITSMVHNFIIQKADYVATHPYEINAEEIRHLFEEIEQVVRLTPPI